MTAIEQLRAEVRRRPPIGDDDLSLLVRVVLEFGERLELHSDVLGRLNERLVGVETSDGPARIELLDEVAKQARAVLIGPRSPIASAQLAQALKRLEEFDRG